MRDDEADEADQPADGDGGRGAERRDDHGDEADPVGTGAEGGGLLVADGEHVELAGEHEQHADATRPRRGRGPPRRPTRRG